MLRIQNIKLPVDHGIEDIAKKISKLLKINPLQIKQFQILKKSIDARDKKNLFYVYTVDIAVKDENKYLSIKNVMKADIFQYHIEKITHDIRPVVIGAGPAGLMAAFVLAKAGLNPIVLERGAAIHERKKIVARFWKDGTLLPDTNVLFGEGGAGSFSDGKLNTGTHDPRKRFVLEAFVEAGAPEEILYWYKPHVGTDRLIPMVENLRKKIMAMGGEFRFHHLFDGVGLRQGHLQEIFVKTGQTRYSLPAPFTILAPGHSARDTFEMLSLNHVDMEAKPFAVGVRIEHLQSLIGKSQYGEVYEKLPPAEYKLSAHLKNGRSVYTFCMCPGGYVVGASSEENRLNINGMSYYQRDNCNANSALLVGIQPSDFGGGPLQGLAFQRDLEEKAFLLGGGGYCAPVQRVADFIVKKESQQFGDVAPSYRPGIRPANLWECLPAFVGESILQGIHEFDKKIRGFAHGDAVLTAVESRSSSPLRIIRDETYQSSISGLFPCGEGCGYAGGIMSAAVDGIKCAEKLMECLSVYQGE